MKSLSLLIVLFFSTFFLSCNKNNNPQLPNSEFSFEADGIVVAFNGFFYNLKGSLLEHYSATHYFSLFGQNDINNFLVININTDALQTITYNVSCQARLGSVYYDSSHNCSVTFTKIENNLASGFFSGEIYLNSSSTTPVIITNGMFKDVLIKDAL